MAIIFQYNKTSLQNLMKQLKLRVDILPTIKNKEAALRLEVIKARQISEEIESLLALKKVAYDNIVRLWSEFKPDLITIEDVHLSTKKIAGVRIPILDEVIYRVEPFSLFNNPLWFSDGIEIIKELTTIAIKKYFLEQKMQLLDYARKKTTQKVNLYEKVQIPGYEEAIMKIKRFMEDEENLSKSAQKIVKKRQQIEEGLV